MYCVNNQMFCNVKIAKIKNSSDVVMSFYYLDSFGCFNIRNDSAVAPFSMFDID